MTQETCDIRVLAYLSGAWVDLTADWLGVEPIICRSGMTDNRPVTRVASTGSFTFALNNVADKYSPGHTSALVGWKVGVKIKVIYSYENTPHPEIWYVATPNGIKVDPGTLGPRRVHVTCVDWLDYAAKHPIVNPGILTNQRGDQVLTTALALIPIQPAATNFDTGIETFPTVFDTNTSQTKAYSEIVKATLSEMGYAYLYPDSVYGETLRWENSHYRNGLRTETQYYVNADTPITDENDVVITDENDNPITFSIGTLQAFDGNNTGLYNRPPEITHGDNLLNRLTINAYPRKVDASAVVLFRLSQPILIGEGQTLTLKGTYADPNGGLPVNGQNMITPVATTDYLMNTQSDGLGTNITASLSVTPSYGTEGFTHQLTNGYASVGWVTKFECRGYGIYEYNPIEHAATALASISEYGTQSDTINQKYQKTLDSGRLWGDAIVEYEKEPETRINKITFCANTSPAMMQAFLTFRPGDVVRLQDAKTGIDAYHYIQSREYVIMEGRIIMFSWIVKEFLTLALGLSMVSVSFTGGSTDMINYGIIPHVSNLRQMTVLSWIYINSNVATSRVVLALTNVPTGWSVLVNGQALIFNGKKSITSGQWYSGNLPIGQWTRIAITYDTSTNPLAEPIRYIDGAVAAVNGTTSSPAGTWLDETGVWLNMGNVNTTAFPMNLAFDGKIKDTRIYNRILSPTEIALDSIGITTDSGLVFQGPVVRTKDLSYFTEHTLLSTDRLLDNIYGIVGAPHGAPVTRLP